MGERVITATRLRDDGLLALELGDRPWIALDPLVAVRLGLDVGVAPDADTMRAAEAEADRGAALLGGARLVARRSHARGELERKLARRNGEEAAREAADRLVELGAVDDERHAREVAERRLASGWGPARIAHDLAEAGVDEQLANEVLATLDPDAVLAAGRLALDDREGVEGWRRLGARGFDEETAEQLLGTPGS